MSFHPSKPREPCSAKDATSRAIDQAGGPKRVAAILDRSPTAVAAWSDPAIPKGISYAHARQLTTLGASAFAEDLALQLGATLVPGAVDASSFEKLVAKSSREHGAFIADAFTAVSNGVIDRRERARLRGDLRNLVAALSRCYVALGESD